MTDLVKNLAIGAVSGCLATVPMSWAMEVMHRLLPTRESHPLPPRLITEHVMRTMGVNRELTDEQKIWLSLAAHLAYGAGVGAMYAPLAHHSESAPLAKGTLYGTAVWAGSYLGLLPALGILSSATKHPVRRTALMIAAHLVWGSATGIFVDMMETRRKREHFDFLGARRGTPRSEKQHA